jgi:hypothetical protein
MAARVVLISVRSHDDERRPARHHDDGAKDLPGWAKHREPLVERPAVNKNISDVGRWIKRAEANSGPRIAPGTGAKK